jgi:hypothetical protein
MTKPKPKATAPAPNYELKVDAESNGKLGTATILAIDRDTNKTLCMDKGNVASAAVREKITNRLAAKLGLRTKKAVDKLRQDVEGCCNNRGAANELALESSLIAAPVLSLMAKVNTWEGTASDLLDALENGHVTDKVKNHKEWPGGAGAARKLSGELRRLAPNLRRVSVQVDFDRREPGGRRRRLIRLESARETPSRPSPPSQTPENAGEDAGRTRDGGDGTEPGTVPDQAGKSAAFRDGRDGGDGVSQTFSGAPVDEGEGEWVA